MEYNDRHNQKKDGVITMHLFSIELGFITIYLPSIQLIERIMLWLCVWYIALDFYKVRLPHALSVWRRLNKEKSEAKQNID